MALSDPYATPPQYRGQVGKTDAGDDTEIARNIVAVQRLIENECGRTFNKDDANTTRVYTPGDREWIEIEDVVSVANVTIDSNDDRSFAGETALASTAYELYPLNAAQGYEPWPYTMLHRVDRQPWPGIYLPDGRIRFYRVQVTGIHGFPAVPAPIIEATIQLTAILRLESPRATSRIDEAGTVIGTSRAAQDIIERLKGSYKRNPSRVAAAPFFLV